MSECSSTQDELKQLFSSGNFGISPNTLISTLKQSNGRGRGSHQWTHFPESLAFSFTISPNPTLTLTSLELGVLIADYFEQHLGPVIKLKWPNDLHYQNRGKVGGILCEKLNELIFVGVGINLANNEISPEIKNRFPYPIDALPIFDGRPQHQHLLSRDLYQYILDHRLSNPHGIIEKWHQKCIHLNQEISWIDGQEKRTGIFKRLGLNGQAMVQYEKEILEIWSGAISIEPTLTDP